MWARRRSSRVSDVQQQSKGRETSSGVASSASWRVLAVLCMAQCLMVLNLQTVALAVPLLVRAFDLEPARVQWVIGANELAFGGLLLLAGRVADLFGHRRTLLIGLGLYTAAALLSGFAPTAWVLIAARVAQGIAAALLTPAALALLSSSFDEGAARTRALGVWGGVGQLGGIVGILLGGALAGFGWAWVFWLNVPLGALAFGAALRVLPATPPRATRRRLDLSGALVGAAGFVALTWALTQMQQSQRAALFVLGLAVALLALFISIERRAREPLVPRELVRRPTIVRANLLTLLHAATTNTPIFFFALYLQQVRGASPFATGVGFLPANVGVMAGAALGARFANRSGPRLPAMGGMGLIALALLLFGTIGIAARYLIDLFPGLVIYGVGIGMASVAVNVAGSSGLSDEIHGSAWGLINTSARIGTALGLALLVAVAASVTTAQAGDAAPSSAQLVAGWRWAFRAGAGLALVGMATAALLPPYHGGRWRGALIRRWGNSCTLQREVKTSAGANEPAEASTSEHTRTYAERPAKT